MGLEIKEFRLGNRFVDLRFFLTPSQEAKLIHKFSSATVEASEVRSCMVELFRYLYLSAYSSKSTFFPGNKLVDDLWHSLITETSSYRELCEKIKPNCFIDHSGVYFSDYIVNKTALEIHEEQCSYLASYYENFGDISVDAYKCTPLFESIANRLQVNLDGLNTFAKTIAMLSQKNISGENWDALINEIFLNSSEISRSFVTLGQFLNRVFKSAEVIEEKNISPERLRDVFGVSISLGFTLWQHLAAVERLGGLKDWLHDGVVQFEKLQSGEEKVGLATTHLAGPKGSLLTAKRNKEGFKVSGEAPWVCGHRIFDKLLIGFDCDDEIMFALIQFPSVNSEEVKIQQLDLCEMNGMATVKIAFNNYFIELSEVISKRKKDAPALPRKTSYVLPELGVADRIIKVLKNETDASSHPKALLIRDAIVSLENRLDEIIAREKNEIPIEALIADRDDLNRDALRIMAIFMGAKSLLKDSWVSRVQTELLLMDVVIHSPASLKEKIFKIAGDKS